jgi:hypothetical protein
MLALCDKIRRGKLLFGSASCTSCGVPVRVPAHLSRVPIEPNRGSEDQVGWVQDREHDDHPWSREFGFRAVSNY